MVYITPRTHTNRGKMIHHLAKDKVLQDRDPWGHPGLALEFCTGVLNQNEGA